MKIDWKRKLTSRKFWFALISFVTSMVLIFGGSQEQANQIAGVILQGATLLAYCIGEGFADSNNSEKIPDIVLPTSADPEEDKYWD